MSLSRVVTIDKQILSSGHKDLLKQRRYRIPYDFFTDVDRIFSKKKTALYLEERCFGIRKFEVGNEDPYPCIEALGFVRVLFVSANLVDYEFGDEFSIEFRRSLDGHINRIRVRVRAEFNSVTLNMEDCYYYEEKINFVERVNALEYLRVWFLRQLDSLSEDDLGIAFGYEDDDSKKFGSDKSRIKFKFVNRGLTSTFDVGECDIPDRQTALAMVRKSIIVQLFDY